VYCFFLCEDCTTGGYVVAVHSVSLTWRSFRRH